MRRDVDIVPESIRIPRIETIYKVLNILINSKGEGITCERIHFNAEMSFAGVSNIVLPFLKAKGFVVVRRRDGRSRNIYITPAGELFYNLIKYGSEYYETLRKRGLPK